MSGRKGGWVIKERNKKAKYKYETFSRSTSVTQSVGSFFHLTLLRIKLRKDTIKSDWYFKGKKGRREG